MVDKVNKNEWKVKCHIAYYISTSNEYKYSSSCGYGVAYSLSCISMNFLYFIYLFLNIKYNHVYLTIFQ